MAGVAGEGGAALDEVGEPLRVARRAHRRARASSASASRRAAPGRSAVGPATPGRARAPCARARSPARTLATRARSASQAERYSTTSTIASGSRPNSVASRRRRCGRTPGEQPPAALVGDVTTVSTWPSAAWKPGPEACGERRHALHVAGEVQRARQRECRVGGALLQKNVASSQRLADQHALEQHVGEEHAHHRDHAIQRGVDQERAGRAARRNLRAIAFDAQPVARARQRVQQRPRERLCRSPAAQRIEMAAQRVRCPGSVAPDLALELRSRDHARLAHQHRQQLPGRSASVAARCRARVTRSVAVSSVGSPTVGLARHGAAMAPQQRAPAPRARGSRTA